MASTRTSSMSRLKMSAEKTDFVIAFHAQIDAKRKMRSLRKDDRWYQVYRFAGAGQVCAFRLRLGGN